ASINGVTTAVNAMNTNLYQVLYNMGMAINQNTSKVSSTVEAAARSERELAVAQERNRRYEDARRRYVVPRSICSEAGSGGVSEVGAASGSAKGSVRPRGGAAIADAAISQAVNAPPVAPEIDASRAAKIHAQFCDADDFAAYGGAQACPALSTAMPGADKRLDTLFTGAGPNGKSPDLTFNQRQLDAALMYVQNGIRRSVAPQLRKGEADTTAGVQYVGLQTQFQAILSAAADPLEQQIADSAPNPVTRSLLQEALTSPSANAYYRQVASAQARSTGVMSAREFEAFEVGRRYANAAYQSDLQEMNDTNLTRELIRVTALNAWLMEQLKTEVRRGNIIQGLALASAARQEYGPILSQRYRAVSGRMGGQ
ncbi:MAG TPA: conjugal transfer protein TraW, partial [Burkholderiaceae bacterium]|nr:conjugal transfer protein TraW [Burkholderiaceae bacterium]